MSSAVSLFIIVFTIANILACLWLMWWTTRRRVSAEPQGNTTGHVWDEDLTEYNNPLPRWWLGLFVLTIVFAIGYLIYYPGLGNYRGTSGWTQTQQYDAEIARANAALEARLATLKDKSLEVLAQDAGAMNTAKNLFAMNCVGCHGSDARGAKGFPNLTDGDWLYGGTPENIFQTIAHGRNGVMPAWGSVLGEQGVEEVAAYVLSLSGTKGPADWIAAGKTKFETTCAGCHGVDGRGNQMIGAPNLTDKVWLYGGTLADVRQTITNGRSGKMPAHIDTLGEMKVKLLAAYVLKLSGGAAGASTAMAGTGGANGGAK